jgi:hypothetical protein
MESFGVTMFIVICIALAMFTTGGILKGCQAPSFETLSTGEIVMNYDEVFDQNIKLKTGYYRLEKVDIEKKIKE